MDQVRELAAKLNQVESIAILTGAGVSTASGIPDFRSTKGFWSQDRSREYYMSRDYFLKDPEDFWLKYKEIFRIKLLKDYQPNNVHLFLKRLEQIGKHVSIITQNVDGLHTLAGSEHVIEYHGNLSTATCPNCGKNYDLTYIMKEQVPHCSAAGCGDILKPDIVLFGDPIIHHRDAEEAIDTSQFVLVLGTSLLVTPFSLLPDYAKQEANVPMAIINRETTPKDYLFDYVIQDDLVPVINQIEQHMAGSE